MDMKRLITISMVLILSLLITPLEGQIFKKLGNIVKETTETTENTKNTKSQTVTENMSTQDLYVNNKIGSNKNDGSKSSPFKNIQVAVDAASPGATIHIAEGVYMGKLNCGYVEIKQYLSIIGGYSADFSERDPLKYRTMFQPDLQVAASGTNTSKGLINITVKGNPNGLVVVDGIIFDRGESNCYWFASDRVTSSWPIGVETPRLWYAGMGGGIALSKGEAAPFANDSLARPRGTHPSYINTNAMLNGEIEGDVIIRNCVFVNGSWFGIQMGNMGGKWVLTNNVFVNNRMSACEIRGMHRNPNMCKIEFSHNTVLYTWTRNKPSGDDDMGYGVRCMTGVDMDIHHNILGACFYGAIDRTYIDSDANREKLRVTSVTDNLFFMNKNSDLTLPSGGGKFTLIFSKDFEDVDQLKNSSGNREFNDEQFIKSLNEPYLKGWVNFSCGETSSYNPNSSANQVRAIFGMNQQGSITTRATMHANHYPVDDCFKLFGAVSGYGAQAINR